MDENDFNNGDITIQYIDMHQELLGPEGWAFMGVLLIVGSIAYDSVASPELSGTGAGGFCHLRRLVLPLLAATHSGGPPKPAWSALLEKILPTRTAKSSLIGVSTLRALKRPGRDVPMGGRITVPY